MRHTVPVPLWATAYPRGGVRAKNLFAPRIRVSLAYSLSKSSYDFGIRNRMEFCCCYMTLRLHSNGHVRDPHFCNGLFLFLCNQTMFKSIRYTHAVNRRKLISARNRPSVFDFVYVHLPNLPIESNKSLIAALALVRDCLSISMPTFLWPTAFSTAF